MFLHRFPSGKPRKRIPVPPRLPEKIADFHVHLFPDRMFTAIWNRFVSDYGWNVLHRLHYRECLDHLAERGVGLVAYSNYAHRKGVARWLNDWNLKVLSEYPDLYCFAAWHPDDEDALAMAEELLKHPRILGFKLQLLVQCFYPHDERLFPLYEMIREKGKRILFHVGTGPVGNPFVGADAFLRVMERYPDLPANVAHMGGLEYARFLDMVDRFPNLTLDTAFSFLPGISFDQGPESLAAREDRIVYGSDFPNLIHPRESEIENLLSLDLPESFYRKVFWENARALVQGNARPATPPAPETDSPCPPA